MSRINTSLKKKAKKGRKKLWEISEMSFSQWALVNTSANLCCTVWWTDSVLRSLTQVGPLQLSGRDAEVG